MKKINSFFVGLFIFISTLSMAQSVVTNRNGKEITVNSPASTSAQGQVQLAGDLAGTADAPTVPALTNKLEGSGTLNYIPKFTAGKTLGNSLLFDNGTNVGVGTTSPGNKLEITQGTAGNSGLRFTNLNSTSAANTASSKVLGLNSNGDVILTNVPGTQNIVAFSTATPTSSGVVFTPNTPADQSVVYQSAVDNSMWTYNGTAYVTYIPPASTAWFTSGTTDDAGNSKTSTIYRTGNVGIGSLTTPLALLHLQTTSQAKMLFETTNGAGGQASIDLKAGSSQWWRIIGQGTSNGRRLEIYNQTANNSAFNITPSNNVGIGTQNPTANLEVATMNGLSAIIRRGGSSAQTPANLILQKTTGTNANATGAVTNGDFVGRVLFSASNGTATYPTNGTDIVGYAAGLQSASNNGGGILFRTVPQNSIAQSLERMRIDENGNVGIGTIAPTNRLEINSGTTGASGLKFTQLTAASTNTSTAISSPIGVDANGVVVPLGSSRRVEPLVLNATYDITVNTFGGYKVTVAGSDASFNTFADEYIITIANSFLRLSVQQIGGVYSASSTAQVMRTAYNVASATLTPSHGRYSITFNASGTSNVITTRALVGLAIITTKTQSLW
jgi:hypothetical protein